MKTLLLLRHGKAEASAPGGDHERALKKKGRNDSASVGTHLASMGKVPDLVVSSDARRAEETARLAAEAAGYKAHLKLEPDIYAADLDTLLDVVHKLPDKANSVLMVGHNPGFEELAAALASEGTQPPHLATCGLAILEFSTDHWKSARPGSGHLAGVYNPET